MNVQRIIAASAAFLMVFFAFGHPALAGEIPSYGSIRVEKQVRNLSRDQALARHIEAWSGDTLEYRITVWISRGSSTEVVVTDTFDGQSMQYITGSLMVDGRPHPPGLTSGGLRLRVSGQPVSIVYRARVLPNPRGGVSSTVTAWTPYGDRASDTVQINVRVTNTGYTSPYQSNQYYNDWCYNDSYTMEYRSSCDRSAYQNSYPPIGSGGDWCYNDSYTTEYRSSCDLDAHIGNGPRVPSGGDWCYNDSYTTEYRSSCDLTAHLRNSPGNYPGTYSNRETRYQDTYRAYPPVSSVTTIDAYPDNNYSNNQNQPQVYGPPPTNGYFVAPLTGWSGFSALTFGGLLTAGFAAFRNRKRILEFVNA